MTTATEPDPKPGSDASARFPGRPILTIATEPAYLGNEERTEFPGRACRLREPPAHRLPCHQKRAGLGVWACTRSREDRAAVKLWKRRAPLECAELEAFAAALPDPPLPMVLVVDDLVTSGATMRRSLDAIRKAG
jgi:hypothetical protein